MPHPRRLGQRRLQARLLPDPRRARRPRLHRLPHDLHLSDLLVHPLPRAPPVGGGQRARQRERLRLEQPRLLLLPSGRARVRRVAALSALLAGSTGAIAPPAVAQEVARGAAPAGRRDVDAPVTQVAADGVYFAAGSDAGVVVGARGTLERDGRVIAEIEVRHASATSSFAALLTLEPDVRPQAGDRAVLRGLGPPGEATSRAPASGDAAGDAKPFTPLLAPAVKADSTTRGNLFHGSAGFSTSWLRDLENDREYLNLRLSTAGDVERLGGGPWSLQYRLDLDRRSGDGYDGDPQRDEWRPRLDTAILRRHFDDGSVVGLGRFTPLALQGIGRIDGAYAEEVVGDGARIGGLVGFRPDRENYGPRTNDLIAAGWG